VGLAQAFSWPLPNALLAGILLVAACPSGGFSNILTSLAKGDLALSVALTTISSLLSFITVPALIFAFALILPAISGTVQIPIGPTLAQLVVLVVLPVAAGMMWRQRWPAFVEPRLARIQTYTQAFAYFVMIMVIYQQWDQVKYELASALPWAFVLCIVGLSVGYFFARGVRLSPTDAVTVAIEGSIRNLTVSFLIATTVLQRFDIAVFSMVYFAAVLVVGIASALLWRRWGPRAGVRTSL
jgi:BASS family bile acid:Na+ symporter